MLRLIGLAVLVGGGFLLLSRTNVVDVSGVKQKAIEAVNPSAKESRLLGEANDKLAEVKKALDNNPAGLGANEVKNLATTITETQMVINEASIQNEKGGVLASMGQLVSKFAGTASSSNSCIKWITPPRSCLRWGF